MARVGGGAVGFAALGARGGQVGFVLAGEPPFPIACVSPLEGVQGDGPYVGHVVLRWGGEVVACCAEVVADRGCGGEAQESEDGGRWVWGGVSGAWCGGGRGGGGAGGVCRGGGGGLGGCSVSGGAVEEFETWVDMGWRGHG